jgi:hypothetical protein
MSQWPRTRCTSNQHEMHSSSFLSVAVVALFSIIASAQATSSDSVEEVCPRRDNCMQPSSPFQASTGLQALLGPRLAAPTRTDIAQCEKQKHCLICQKDDTRLSCYENSCQCKKGSFVHLYMPDSDWSCAKNEMCMTCPHGSRPFSWGQIAICFDSKTHKPLTIGNPLTGWTNSSSQGRKPVTGGASSVAPSTGPLSITGLSMAAVGLLVAI